MYIPVVSLTSDGAKPTGNFTKCVRQKSVGKSYNSKTFNSFS